MGNLLERCKRTSSIEKSTYELSLIFPGIAVNNNKGQERSWYEYCKLENPNCIALNKYEKNEPDEINLEKNDLLILVNARENKNFCLIKNLRTRLIGKVPRNLIKTYSQPRAEP
jgi:hypothetical protein